MLTDFEVIEIVDDNNPYHVLLGIEWDIDMNGVINFKKLTMSFERKSLRVVVPLDPAKGSHYTKLVRDCEESDDDLDQIYKITKQYQDWVNPMVDGWIEWDYKSSYTSNSDEELEHWQNMLHKVSRLCCNMMTKSLRCLSSEVRNITYYDGLIDIDKLLDAFKREVPEGHRFQKMDLALRTMPAQWWGTQKENFDE